MMDKCQFECLRVGAGGCNMMMFNKTEGTLFKSSQFLHSNLFPNRNQEQSPSRRPSFIETTNKFSKSCHTPLPVKKGLILPSSQSRTINIQFNSMAKKVLPEQVLQRRRMLSSSDKFYNKKKAVVFNIIRQKNQKYQEMLGRKDFEIGANKITPYLRAADGAPLGKPLGIAFQKKMKKERREKVKDQSFFKESSSVLLLQRKKLTKMDDFFSTVPPTFRKMTEPQNGNIQISMKQKTEPIFKEKLSSTPEFEQFIPVRRRKQKKEPFVCGMADKTFFVPQKMNEKLVFYHDFLWKVNYSNGLFVKVSQNEQNYTAFVGPGNNCSLVRSILKRRYWWTISQKAENCQFVWTQLKSNNIFKAPSQKQSQTDIYKIYYSELAEEVLSETEDVHHKIFNKIDLRNWRQHISKNQRYEQTLNERTYKHRTNFHRCKRMSIIQNSASLVVHNHLPCNYYIGNKKALFYFMRNYYDLKQENLAKALPLTFHVTTGVTDPSYKAFLNVYQQNQERKRRGEDVRNIWIIKPGENSNRGKGITVCFSLDDIKNRVNGRQRSTDGKFRTFILQKYIEKPLLYRGRKFDLRHYMLLTCFNGIFRAYWFPQGYVRTASAKFSLGKDANPYIHLTNDAVQKNCEEYGRYEKGNKVSYQTLSLYISKGRSKKEDREDIFFGKILPRMKELALDAVRATFLHLDPLRRQHNFQLLGMDFMIDESLSPLLIEINTNPCLQLSCPLLASIIPSLIEETFKLCIDPFFPPPTEWQLTRRPYFSQHPLEQLSFQLLFDESVDGGGVRQLLENSAGLERRMGRVQQDAQTFENDGDFEDE